MDPSARVVVAIAEVPTMDALRDRLAKVHRDSAVDLDWYAMVASWPIDDRRHFQRMTMPACGPGCVQIYGRHLHDPTYTGERVRR